ncbi:hypothetical protein E4U53_003616, partial [Claviceps sorghi]
IDRQHSQTCRPRSTAQTTAVLLTNSQPAPDPTSLLAHPVQGHSNRRVGDHRRGASLPPQLPSLVINKTTTINSNNTSLTVSPSDLFIPALSPGAHPDSATATPRDKYTKVVAFEFPAKEVARCHSPSWEAYERRKMEKKMEKKERGGARKDGTKRLSKKPPPSSSPKALQQALASEADVARGRGRERAEHAAAASGPGLETKPGRKARSRSGSFVSMLRAPFEFRRSASTDQVNDSGFIGGIKLELQRHAHQQQILDSNAVEDESNVHPALRKNNRPSHPPLDCSGTGTPSGTDQRRYPPITRGTNHRQQTAPLVIPPTAPAVHDASTIDKWRSRVGLKSAGSRQQSLASPGGESQLRGPGGAHSTSIDYMPPEHVPSALKSPQDQLESPTSPLSSSKPAAHVTFVVASSATPPLSSAAVAVAPAVEPERQSENRGPPRKHSNNESVSSTSSAATGYKTAPSSPPPPEPPQRSAKRHSISSSGESIPPVPPLTPQQHQQYHSDARAPTKEAGPSAPRSFPLRGNAAKPRGSRQSKPEWAEGATSASTATGQMSPYLSSPTGNGHVPTSSSEESCDEDFFHSASSPSTPATSRPQSERELPLACSPEETPASVHDVVRTCFSKTYPLPSAENSEDEGGVDPIQAAAEKVLAVFNEIPVRRPDVRGRRASQSSLTTDASFEPSASATERTLHLGSKGSRSVDRGSGRPLPSSPPACYLEQARKQRFAPPASVVRPADGSKAAMADPAVRHLRHKSTPRLAAGDRDPIAKVFVECCSCTHYHDMPGNLYKAMSDPEGVLSPTDRCGYAGALSMTVRCSWCKHEMSVRCCAALSAKVYIQERLH